MLGGQSIGAAQRTTKSAVTTSSGCSRTSEGFAYLLEPRGGFRVTGVLVWMEALQVVTQRGQASERFEKDRSCV